MKFINLPFHRCAVYSMFSVGYHFAVHILLSMSYFQYSKWRWHMSVNHNWFDIVSLVCNMNVFIICYLPYKMISVTRINDYCCRYDIYT